MKKIFIILIAIAFSSGFLIAQDKEAGDSKRPKYILGGTLNFTKHQLENVNLEDGWSSSDYDGFTIALEGRFGVATGKHYYLGLIAGYTLHEKGFYTFYNSSKCHYERGYYTRPAKGNIINFAPFMRFHKKLSGKLGYYVDAKLGLEFSSNYIIKPPPNSELKLRFAKLYSEMSIGAELMLSEKIGLEMMIFNITYSEQIKYWYYGSTLKILKTEFIFSNPTMGLIFYF